MGNEIYNWKSIQAAKRKKAKALRKVQRAAKAGNPPKYQPCMKSEFYLTREWRELRWKVLVASDGKCQMCGRGKQDNVILHVDHVLPRSKFPLLELNDKNLQVLCEDCNIGKSNKVFEKQASSVS